MQRSMLELLKDLKIELSVLLPIRINVGSGGKKCKYDFKEKKEC